MSTTLRSRLEAALSEMDSPPTQAEMARAAGVKQPSVNGWFSGKTLTLKGKNLLAVASLLNVSPGWLETGHGKMRAGSNVSNPKYAVNEDTAEYHAGRITLLDVRGSCGGGVIADEMGDRPPLVKEPSWFSRYSVRPENLVAVFADGDSMADFIVDGDIVIFDTSKTEPKTAKIFLIDHPDGLRIKRLRREIDGTWVLESLNADKRDFPDERISLEQVELLKIRGQFVYRQGG